MNLTVANVVDLTGQNVSVGIAERTRETVFVVLDCLTPGIDTRVILTADLVVKAMSELAFHELQARAGEEDVKDKLVPLDLERLQEAILLRGGQTVLQRLDTLQEGLQALLARRDEADLQPALIN